MAKLKLISTGQSFNKYYLSLNNTFHKAFNKQMMLHYPFYNSKDEGLEKRQYNLTDYCISQVDDLKNKKVLEVGCGNGLQTMYIAESGKAKETIGIDIIQENIDLAKLHKQNGHAVSFLVDNAHVLENIEDNSIDTVFCIESAFHYPEKDNFLTQVQRVLKPGGEFLIADILSRKQKKRYLIRKWKKKMYYYHWTMNQYQKSFGGKELKIEKTNYITPDIINGYEGYWSWIKSENCPSYLNFIMMKIFMFVQVKLNVVLLNRRRHYVVFKGRKPAA